MNENPFKTVSCLLLRHSFFLTIFSLSLTSLSSFFSFFLSLWSLSLNWNVLPRWRLNVKITTRQKHSRFFFSTLRFSSSSFLSSPNQRMPQNLSWADIAEKNQQTGATSAVSAVDWPETQVLVHKANVFSNLTHTQHTSMAYCTIVLANLESFWMYLGA